MRRTNKTFFFVFTFVYTTAPNELPVNNASVWNCEIHREYRTWLRMAHTHKRNCAINHFWIVVSVDNKNRAAAAWICSDSIHICIVSCSDKGSLGVWCCVIEYFDISVRSIWIVSQVSNDLNRNRPRSHQRSTCAAVCCYCSFSPTFRANEFDFPDSSNNRPKINPECNSVTTNINDTAI